MLYLTTSNSAQVYNSDQLTAYFVRSEQGHRTAPVRIIVHVRDTAGLWA